MDRKSRFWELLRGLQKDTVVCIVFDSDPDGTSAAVILAKAIERVRGTRPQILMAISHKDQDLCDRIISTVRDKRVEVVFVLDHAFDQHLSRVNEIKQLAILAVIDHHKLYNDFDDDQAFLLKPQIIKSPVEPSQYCTAKLTFDLVSDLIYTADLRWLAAIGIIGDAAYPKWKQFVDDVLKQSGYSVEENIFDTVLGNACSLLGHFDIYSEGKVERAFEVLYAAEKPEDIFSSELIEGMVVGEELKKYLKDYNNYLTEVGGADVILIKAKYRIGSTLATILSMKKPGRTIVVAHSVSGRTYVSARRQDFKIRVNDLLEKAVSGIPDAAAGGHTPAAGAAFPSEHYAKFIGNLRKAHKELVNAF